MFLVSYCWITLFCYLSAESVIALGRHGFLGGSLHTREEPGDLPAYVPMYKVRDQARSVYRKQLTSGVQDVKSMIREVELLHYLTEAQKSDLTGELRSILDHLLIEVVNLLKPYLNPQHRESFPRRVLTEIQGLGTLVTTLVSEAEGVVSEGRHIAGENRRRYTDEPASQEIQQQAAHVLNHFLRLKIRLRQLMQEVQRASMGAEDKQELVADLEQLVSSNEEQTIKDFLKPIARSRKFEKLYPLGTMEKINAVEVGVEEWFDVLDALEDDLEALLIEEGAGRGGIQIGDLTPARRFRRSFEGESDQWRALARDEVLDLLTASMKQVYDDLVETKKSFLEVTGDIDIGDLNKELKTLQKQMRSEFKDKYKYFSVNRQCTDPDDIQFMFDILKSVSLQVADIQEKLKLRLQMSVDDTDVNEEVQRETLGNRPDRLPGRGLSLKPDQLPGRGVGVRPNQLPGRGVGVEPDQLSGRGVGVKTDQLLRRGEGVGPVQLPGRGVGVEPDQLPGRGVGVRTDQLPGRGVGVRPEQLPGRGVGMRTPVRADKKQPWGTGTDKSRSVLGAEAINTQQRGRNQGTSSAVQVLVRRQAALGGRLRSLWQDISDRAKRGQITPGEHGILLQRCQTLKSLMYTSVLSPLNEVKMTPGPLTDRLVVISKALDDLNEEADNIAEQLQQVSQD